MVIVYVLRSSVLRYFKLTLKNVVQGHSTTRAKIYIVIIGSIGTTAINFSLFDFQYGTQKTLTLSKGLYRFLILLSLLYGTYKTTKETLKNVVSGFFHITY